MFVTPFSTINLKHSGLLLRKLVELLLVHIPAVVHIAAIVTFRKSFTAAQHLSHGEVQVLDAGAGQGAQGRGDDS